MAGVHWHWHTDGWGQGWECRGAGGRGGNRNRTKLKRGKGGECDTACISFFLSLRFRLGKVFSPEQGGNLGQITALNLVNIKAMVCPKMANGCAPKGKKKKRKKQITNAISIVTWLWVCFHLRARSPGSI